MADEEKKTEGAEDLAAEAEETEPKTNETTHEGDYIALTNKLQELADQVKALADENEKLQKLNAAMLQSITAGKAESEDDALRAFVAEGR